MEEKQIKNCCSYVTHSSVVGDWLWNRLLYNRSLDGLSLRYKGPSGQLNLDGGYNQESSENKK